MGAGVRRAPVACYPSGQFGWGLLVSRDVLQMLAEQLALQAQDRDRASVDAYSVGNTALANYFEGIASGKRYAADALTELLHEPGETRLEAVK